MYWLDVNPHLGKLRVTGLAPPHVRCSAEKAKPARAEVRSWLALLAPKLAAGARNCAT